MCAFYKFFFDDWQHYWDLCRKAQIGCGEKKKLLAERMIETFKPFREVRAELTPEIVTRILDEGSEKARDVARSTMVGGPRARSACPPTGEVTRPARIRVGWQIRRLSRDLPAEPSSAGGWPVF